MPRKACAGAAANTPPRSTLPAASAWRREAAASCGGGGGGDGGVARKQPQRLPAGQLAASGCWQRAATAQSPRWGVGATHVAQTATDATCQRQHRQLHCGPHLAGTDHDSCTVPHGAAHARPARATRWCVWWWVGSRCVAGAARVAECVEALPATTRALHSRPSCAQRDRAGGLAGERHCGPFLCC
jgi:hypothetical protein